MSLTFSCRADRIRLGDVIAATTIEWLDEHGDVRDTFTFPEVVVTRLELVGDDIIINDRITTSRPNKLDLLLRKGTPQ